MLQNLVWLKAPKLPKIENHSKLLHSLYDTKRQSNLKLNSKESCESNYKPLIQMESKCVNLSCLLSFWMQVQKQWQTLWSMIAAIKSSSRLLVFWLLGLWSCKAHRLPICQIRMVEIWHVEHCRSLFHSQNHLVQNFKKRFTLWQFTLVKLVLHTLIWMKW